MTDTFSISDHHFENAGIEPDKKEDVIEGQANEVENKNEIDLESGSENPVKELQTKDAKTGDKKSEPAKPDSIGGGTDDGAKKDAKKEEEPQLNRTETELDAAAIADARNSKPVRPEIAQRWMHQRDTARQERDSTKSALERTTQELAQVKTQVETYKSATAIIGELAPNEVPGAVRLYSALKTNPVATLKQLLVEAKANGHTVDGIGEGVDTAAINKLLDQRLSAFEKNNGKALDTPSSEPRTIENDTDLFYNSPQFADAKIHDDILGQMLSKNIDDVKAGKAQRVMTNSELYFTLKNAAVAQGFDFSKPLQPQIDAKKQAASDTPNPVKEQKDEAPRLNGNGGIQTEALIPTGSADESFGDIVKRALANAKTAN